jgi:hypothetical protein
MTQLNEDCLIIIFNELQDNPYSLHSCILVNKFWCHIVMPILWRNPSPSNESSSLQLFNMIIYLLPASSKNFLFKNIPELPVLKFSNKPLFNYISFFSQIPSDLINDMAYKLIKEVKDTVMNIE